MDIYNSISSNESDIKELSHELTQRAYELYRAGASPQHAEELIINALGGRYVTDTGDKDLDSAYREIFKKIPKKLEPRLLGFVISRFLYDTAVPPIDRPQIKLPKRVDVFRLPPELIWLMLSLSGEQKNLTYCPSDASLQLATASTSCSNLVTLAAVESSALINSLHSILYNLKILSQNPFKEKPSIILDRSSSAICAFPQQRLASSISIDAGDEIISTTNPEVMGLHQTMNLEPNRLVALVGKGFLTSTGLAENWIKHKMLKEDILEAVIDLPGFIIPSIRWNYSLLVINFQKSPDEKITMVDASEKYHELPHKSYKYTILSKWKDVYSDTLYKSSANVKDFDLKDLINDNDLGPKRRISNIYINKNKDDLKPLKEIAYLYRGYPHSNTETDQINNDLFHEVNIKDIGPGFIINKPQKKIYSDSFFTKSRSQLILQPYDILLSIKGVVGYVALVPDTGDEKWIPNQSFQIIRAKDYNPVILFHQLLSDDIQKIISTNVTGSSVKQLKVDDIKNIQIPIIKEEYKIKLIKEKHKEILETRRKLTELQNHLSENIRYIQNVIEGKIQEGK